MQGYEASLQDVETWLGDDHTLVILPDRLIREPDLFENEKFIELVVNLIEKRQKELRTRSLWASESTRKSAASGAAHAGALGRVALRTQEPRKI
jgi:hypothetical protein